jgi:molybdopterin/thiamine biosynthesis adenylyltransferase
MLVFQVAALGAEGQPLVDGRYEVFGRVADGGDCVSTYVGSEAEQFCPKVRISVHMRSLGADLDLSEIGRAVESILGEVTEERGSPGSSPPSATGSEEHVLGLLRYGLGKLRPRDDLWIFQRELRSRGIDCCLDGTDLLVGFAGRAGTAEDKDGGSFAVNLVRRLGSLSDRDGGLIDRAAVGEKTILIIGLGSVGSVAACDLARSGVGRFILADEERLEWGNVVRHAAGLHDVGRLKTRIVADLIEDRNPAADVREIASGLSSETRDVYDEAVRSADVVICATDTRASRLMCNRMCIKHQKPVIFGGLSRGADTGMVFQCRPPETMCYHCFVSSFPEAAADREVGESAYAGGPDGHLALDILPITNLMTKLALIEVQRQTGSLAEDRDGVFSRPWYLWINRLEGSYGDLGPLNSGEIPLQPLRWYPIRMEKLEDCPHCGQPALP